MPVYLRKAIRQGVTEDSPRKHDPANVRAARIALGVARPDTEQTPLCQVEQSNQGHPDFDERELIAQAFEALDSLDPREREILVRRFGLGDESAQSLSEVADHFGVTKERIRQIQCAAVAKLRSQLQVMV